MSQPTSARARVRYAVVVAVSLALLGASDLSRTPAGSRGTGPARQTGGEIEGVRFTGDAGITETVAEIMGRSGSARRRAAGARRYKTVKNHFPERDDLPNHPDSPSVSSASQSAPTAGSAAPNEADFAVGRSFLAVDMATAGIAPPDSTGAVSDSQIAVAVNGYLAIFDKNGTQGALATTMANFFDRAKRTPDVGDPRVRFDRLSRRWFVTILEVPVVTQSDLEPNAILLAVSDGPEITLATRFTFFRFDLFPAVQQSPPPDILLDYETLGVDANALYIGVSSVPLNTPTWPPGTSLFVLSKAALLAGGPPVVTAFPSVGLRSEGGIFTAQGVSNDDPDATEGYFVGVDWLERGVLHVRRVIDPGGRPRLSPDLTVVVPTTSLPRPAPARGVTGGLQSIDDRLFAAEIFRNAATGERTLWAAHSIQTDTSGVAGSQAARTAARWYEIGDLGATPSLKQAGTIVDGRSSAAAAHFTFPTVAVSAQGHAVLGFTASSPQDYPGVAVAWRLAGDPLGTFRPWVVAQPGLAVYRTGQGPHRWGDYSLTVVDPSDAMTFWTFQEYVSSENTWGLHVVEIKAPPPASIASTAAVSVAVGGTTTVTIDGVSAAGSGFFDPGPGYERRLSATVSGSGVAVTAVRYVSPTRVELDLAVAGDAPTGPRALTITNPDGQSVTGADAISVGPAITSVKVKSGSIVAKGRGLTEQMTVAVDGVGFAEAARVVKAKKVVQRGSLSDGRTIDQAIPRGRPVTLTFTTSTGGVTAVSYTRP